MFELRHYSTGIGTLFFLLMKMENCRLDDRILGRGRDVTWDLTWDLTSPRKKDSGHALNFDRMTCLEITKQLIG